VQHPHRQTNDGQCGEERDLLAQVPAAGAGEQRVRERCDAGAVVTIRQAVDGRAGDTITQTVSAAGLQAGQANLVLR
jgi:hypothetical protein